MQEDGVAMGSPVGVLFVQAFMAHVEHRTLQNIEAQQQIYGIYINIFVGIKDEKFLDTPRIRLQEISSLRFTTELTQDNWYVCNKDRLHTSEYRKHTDSGKYMNAEEHCCNNYKNE